MTPGYGAEVILVGSYVPVQCFFLHLLQTMAGVGPSSRIPSIDEAARTAITGKSPLLFITRMNERLHLHMFTTYSGVEGVKEYYTRL